MVSWRGTALKLLALRGRLSVQGARLADIELHRGLVVEFARDFALEVVEVQLPQRVPALRVAAMQERVVSGVCSLFASPAAELRAGLHPGAVAHVWVRGGTFVLRQAGAPDQVLAHGDVVDVGGIILEVLEMALGAQGQYVTTASGGLAAPLELVARYESVCIYRKDEPALVLTGISARILSELVTFGVPVPWTTVAREIWPDDEAGEDLRVKWDVNVGRLRRKLRDARIRMDLVRSDGHGNIELLLDQGDVVRDET